MEEYTILYEDCVSGDCVSGDKLFSTFIILPESEGSYTP